MSNFLKTRILMIILLFGIFWAAFPNNSLLNLPIHVSLSQVVQNVIKDSNGEYAVVVKNLKTNESYSYNEHISFDSGSLYKLWVMAEAFKQIQNESLSEASVADDLDQMITISDNSSALFLTDEVTPIKVEDFLKENAFKESTIGMGDDMPKTTAFDVASFFEKLYKGKLADKQNTNEMLNLLKNQQINNKLPKYLPKGTIIAHKTGELDNFSHDAGIVYSERGDYVIVVLSKSDNLQEAEDRIAKISQAIYGYFTN